MNLLEDSNLEALTFNYLSFGVINNLWTWIAVITAAVSFWKIRASGCPKPELLPPLDDRVSDRPDPEPEVSELDAVSEPACAPRVVVGYGGADIDGVTKGKFTVYYEDDVECESEEALTVTDEWEDRRGRSDGCDSEWWEGWERLLRLRVGEIENGWYTCQDLTALNGNVVRLWDDGFSAGTLTRDSSNCVHVW